MAEVKRPELLAPAGDLEKLKIAVEYGADAVYFGGELFSLRAGAGNLSVEEIREVYRAYYREGLIRFAEGTDENGFLSAGAFAGRDDLEVSVFGNGKRILLVSRFDNLGKGASGAAIQNMNIALGLDETTGLVVE